MPNKNKEKFDRYEAKLLKEGHQVFNAQRYLQQNENIPYAQCSSMCFHESTKCDRIALIGGWDASDRIRAYILEWTRLKCDLWHFIRRKDVEELSKIPMFKRVDIIYRIEDVEKETQV